MSSPTDSLSPLRILAVEDDPLQARALRLHLLEMGYDAPLLADNADAAEALFRAEAPDLVLLDIHLRGEADGIDLARRLRARRPGVPLIFLTSAHDRSTFDRARTANPHAFLTKPYDQSSLHRAIELAAQSRASGGMEPDAPASAVAADDHLWLRDGSRLVRATLNELRWVEADGSYCHVHTTGGRKFTLRQSMRELEERLPTERFMRVHRGYLVQVAALDSVDLPNEMMTVDGHGIPLGRAYRDSVVQRLRLL